MFSSSAQVFDCKSNWFWKQHQIKFYLVFCWKFWLAMETIANVARLNRPTQLSQLSNGRFIRKFILNMDFCCWALVWARTSRLNLWDYICVTSKFVISHITSRLNLWYHKLPHVSNCDITNYLTFQFVISQIHHKSRVISQKVMTSRKKTCQKREFFVFTWDFRDFYSRKTHVFVTGVCVIFAFSSLQSGTPGIPAFKYHYQHDNGHLMDILVPNVH